LSIAGMLGAVGTVGEMRRNAEDAPPGSPAATARAQARLAADSDRLRAQLAGATATRPLLAALSDRVDGATLMDLFREEDWWSEVRSEFQVARVIVGEKVLVTTGSPDPGLRDREVVAQAR